LTNLANIYHHAKGLPAVRKVRAVAGDFRKDSCGSGGSRRLRIAYLIFILKHFGQRGDEMTPSIETARKIAKILGTTVGYLLDETKQENLFKDPDMLKRLNEIEKMDKEDKNHILYAIDAFIKSVKLKNIAAL